MKAYGCMEMKIYTNELYHMTKLVPVPIYSKNF